MLFTENFLLQRLFFFTKADLCLQPNKDHRKKGYFHFKPKSYYNLNFKDVKLENPNYQLSSDIWIRWGSNRGRDMMVKSLNFLTWIVTVCLKSSLELRLLVMVRAPSSSGRHFEDYFCKLVNKIQRNMLGRDEINIFGFGKIHYAVGWPRRRHGFGSRLRLIA